jgi:hypothetical protein
MLASHAALCELTGSWEILVFHTLSAGNIGQFGAPGTVVAVTGAAVVADVAAATGTAAVAGAAAVTGAPAATVVAAGDAGVTLVVDAAPQPAADTATKAPATIQRPTRCMRELPPTMTNEGDLTELRVMRFVLELALIQW